MGERINPQNKRYLLRRNMMTNQWMEQGFLLMFQVPNQNQCGNSFKLKIHEIQLPFGKLT